MQEKTSFQVAKPLQNLLYSRKKKMYIFEELNGLYLADIFASNCLKEFHF